MASQNTTTAVSASTSNTSQLSQSSVTPTLNLTIFQATAGIVVQEDYSPVDGVYTRLIIMCVLCVVLGIIAAVISCWVKKRGGWDQLCKKKEAKYEMPTDPVVD